MLCKWRVSCVSLKINQRAFAQRSFAQCQPLNFSMFKRGHASSWASMRSDTHNQRTHTFELRRECCFAKSRLMPLNDEGCEPHGADPPFDHERVRPPCTKRKLPFPFCGSVTFRKVTQTQGRYAYRRYFPSPALRGAESGTRMRNACFPRAGARVAN